MFRCEIIGNEKGCLRLNLSAVVQFNHRPFNIHFHFYHHRYELSSCYLVIIFWFTVPHRVLYAHRDEGLPLIGTAEKTILTNYKFYWRLAYFFTGRICLFVRIGSAGLSFITETLSISSQERFQFVNSAVFKSKQPDCFIRGLSQRGSHKRPAKLLFARSV